MEEFIKLDLKSGIPKYKQIVRSIYAAIENNVLKEGTQIPSFNELSDEYGISRNTVITAYMELKAKGVISSSPGKGFYVSNTNLQYAHKIFVLFDELSAYKEI